MPNPTNPYKELCEDLVGVFEAMGLSIGDPPETYEDEYGVPDHYRYLEDLQDRFLALTQKYVARLSRLDPSYRAKSPLFRMMEEAKRAYASESEQGSPALRALRVAEQRDSHRPTPLSVVT